MAVDSIEIYQKAQWAVGGGWVLITLIYKLF